MVVATPSAGRSFYMDYKDGSQKWETFLVTEFLDHLRAKYKVTRERRGTLLFGISMGGMGALRMGFKYPEKFAGLAAMEPGIDPATEMERPAAAQQILARAGIDGDDLRQAVRRGLLGSQ